MKVEKLVVYILWHRKFYRELKKKEFEQSDIRPEFMVILDKCFQIDQNDRLSVENFKDDLEVMYKEKN